MNFSLHFQSTTAAEFNKASFALNNYWSNRWNETSEMIGVLQEFMKFYVLNDDNSGWWAGFAPECGRTNNGLESHNRQFK